MNPTAVVQDLIHLANEHEARPSLQLLVDRLGRQYATVAAVRLMDYVMDQAASSERMRFELDRRMEFPRMLADAIQSLPFLACAFAVVDDAIAYSPSLKFDSRREIERLVYQGYRQGFQFDSLPPT